MILADKIINERKKMGMSQEELAEKLSVSRQSISKWEGAQSVPDLSRIIQMAELFGVTTDYLLKDEMEAQPMSDLKSDVETNSNTRKVSMEEASEYVAMEQRHAPLIAAGVSLCVLSPALLIALTGLAEGQKIGLTEEQGAGIGMVVLLTLVAIAVFLFVKNGLEGSRFEYLEKVVIDTEYGVDGMAREGRDRFMPTFNRNIAIGVILCIVGVIPMVSFAILFEDDGSLVCCMVGLLLACVAAAVNLFVRAGIVKGSYDKLLQEGDYTVNKKRGAPLLNRISSIYWMSTTAIYLGWSFWTFRWDFTWIVWPVAAVAFAVVMTIVKMVIKAED